MHKEYRRFLLKKEVSSILKDLKTKVSPSDIFFTKIKLCRETKYIHTHNAYHKVIQRGTQHTKSITYSPVGKKEFAKRKKEHKGALIHLDDYLVKLDACTMHIEAYNHDLGGLYLLTVPDSCLSFSISEKLYNSYIGKYIEADVSDDPRYEQKYLALFGNPTRHPYDIYAIFKDLEQKRLASATKVIFAEMKSADAIRIYLYEKYILLQDAAKTLQKGSGEERANAIGGFRDAVHQSLLIMKIYEELFDEQQYRKIHLHLTTLLNVTKTYTDLALIEKKVIKLNHKLQSDYLHKMLVNIQTKMQREANKIENYFQSREFNIITTQLQRFIQEKHKSYLNYESQLPFGYSAKVKVSAKHADLLQTINFLEGCNDKKSYEKLQNALEELIDFITIFEKQIDSKRCKSLLKKAEKIYSILKKYEQRNKYLLIIKMLLTHMDDSTETDEIRYLKKKKKKLIKKQKKFNQTVLSQLPRFNM